ncbi:MAG TPA: putative toxin-antitoxin system toxin component, PIN family [Herpetosiphonaceae bacterium]
MKVIIDTNVVISAALKDRNPEHVILFVVQHPAFEWIASQEILDEYIGVLHRPKFRLPEVILQRWMVMFTHLVMCVDVQKTVDFPRDQKDAKFLACAIAADAEYLITGDRDFTEAYKIVNTTVLSVSQFKRYVCDVW